MTEKSNDNQYSVHYHIHVHGGNVTIHFHSPLSSSDQEQLMSETPPEPVPQTDPRITLIKIINMGNAIKVEGVGNTPPPSFSAVFGKVVCSNDTALQDNPWSDGNEPTRAVVDTTNNNWDILSIPLPAGCNNSYKLYVWGIYADDDEFNYDSQVFMGSGSGQTIMTTTDTASASPRSTKAAPRQFQLRPVFPGGDPTQTGLSEDIDFGTQAQLPQMQFDESAGWVSPVWKQVQTQHAQGEWVLRLLDRGQHYRGELSWQTLQPEGHTLGVWVCDQWNLFEPAEFQMNGSSSNSPGLPWICLEPA